MLILNRSSFTRKTTRLINDGGGRVVSLRRVILRVKLFGLQSPCTPEFGPEFDAASYKRELYARVIERRKNYSNRSSIAGVTRNGKLRGLFFAA